LMMVDIVCHLSLLHACCMKQPRCSLVQFGAITAPQHGKYGHVGLIYPLPAGFSGSGTICGCMDKMDKPRTSLTQKRSQVRVLFRPLPAFNTRNALLVRGVYLLTRGARKNCKGHKEFLEEEVPVALVRSFYIEEGRTRAKVTALRHQGKLKYELEQNKIVVQLIRRSEFGNLHPHRL
jgi:hypothetical protein